MKPNDIEIIISQIFELRNASEFNELALEIFQLQYKNVAVYREYCDAVYDNPLSISNIENIPFLPIQFFKSKPIIWDSLDPDNATVFKSSGTTETGKSTHLVHNTNIYEQSFMECFRQFYGPAEDIVILALLPSYQEQGNSSLIFMVKSLVEKSEDKRSGFYLKSEDIISHLNSIEKDGKKCLLLGVTYALLDLIESQTFQLKSTIIMETGGMKGRRKEMTKTDLHKILCEGFGVSEIHSEYGMTELLSQAYSTGGEWFQFPSWMKCFLRPVNDPLAILEKSNKTGGINVIDLANIYSCSFIATQDLGRLENDKLKIMGRFDHSDTRGCNLMIE
jgi:phenylacetate-coenzyme A ligase PaaK-like adenylate-forming protein